MRFITVNALAFMTLWLTGCGAPRWVQRGPEAFEKRQRGEVMFLGYSDISELPAQARERAFADAAEKATEWIMQGIKVNEAFPDELHDEPGFELIEEIFIAAVNERLLEEMRSEKRLEREYTRNRKDELETRFEHWQLHGIHRADLALILQSRSLRNEIALDIDRARIGATDSARREIVRHAHRLLDSIAGDIRGLHESATPITR